MKIYVKKLKMITQHNFKISNEITNIEIIIFTNLTIKMYLLNAVINFS